MRPASEFDPNHLPTFAMIAPTLCHDGHDCPNADVDSWLRGFVQPILDGADYRAGRTAVFVLWDEDRPVPNLLVAPSARPGPISAPASHAAALVTIETLLGLPTLAPGPATGYHRPARRLRGLAAQRQLHTTPTHCDDPWFPAPLFPPPSVTPTASMPWSAFWDVWLFITVTVLPAATFT